MERDPEKQVRLIYSSIDATDALEIINSRLAIDPENPYWLALKVQWTRVLQANQQHDSPG